MIRKPHWQQPEQPALNSLFIRTAFQEKKVEKVSFVEECFGFADCSHIGVPLFGFGTYR